MEFKELLRKYGFSQVGFARHFGIPPKTVRNWAEGVSTPAPYVVALFIRVLDAENAKIADE